ncbi:MAG: thiamine pyrophosphate-dependent enzyme [Planctomycetota bacterium]
MVLILNDSAYGMIKWKQAGMGFGDYGLDFTNPDWVKFAEAHVSDGHGAHGHRVEATEDFVPTLETALKTDGVHLIDVPVDYSENHAVLNQQIKELAAAV